MSRRPLIHLVVTFVVVCMLALPAFAQTGLSRVTGVVEDTTGALIANAKVTLTHEGTNVSQTTETSSSGLYVFSSVPPGKYTVAVEAAGFKKMVSKSNDLAAGVPLTVNFNLQVGATGEQVEVFGTYERVQTSTSGNLGTTLDSKTLTDLPLGLESGTGGRNPLIFIRLQPGLNFGANTGGASHINGARDRAFNYTLDGIDINETSAGGSEFASLRTNPDSLHEFRVVTSNATAEYGRNSGAQVELVTKSGTNQIHGNLFYFHRNAALAANEWENNFNNIRKPNLLQHQWGGSVGGPIKRDRTFFFFNYQGQRQRFPVLQTRTVYTAQARQGLFRYVVGGRNFNAAAATPSVDVNGNALLPVCNGVPPTNQPCIATYNIFANDPRALGADPTMTAWFADTALPNSFLGGDGLNTAQYLFNASRLDPQRDFVVKIDHKFNDNNSLFGRYAWGRQDTDNDTTNSGAPRFPGLPAVVRTERDPRNLAVNYRRVFSPRLTNELVGGFNHFTFNFITPEFGAASHSLITVNPTDPHIYEAGNLREINTWQFIDNLSYQRGSHFFKAGINFRYQQHKDQRGSVAGMNIVPAVTFSQTVNAACAAGTFGAGGTAGVVAGNERFCHPQTTGNLPINTNDIARLRGTINDLLGRVGEIRQGFVANSDLSAYESAGTFFLNDARYPEYDFYFQDNWKLRRNLTIDLGLRWELKLTPRAENRLFRPNQPFVLGSPATNTLKWEEGELYPSDRNNLSPSIGFAWDPWSDGKTSIRANFRQAFDRLNTFVISSAIYNTIPGITLGVVNTAFGQNGGPGGTGGRVRDGFPSLVPPATAVPSAALQPVANGQGLITVVDPNMRAPKTYMWSFDVQRDVGAKIVLDVSYIGRKAQNLFGAYDANEVELFDNNFLSAFNVVAAGGDSPLINQLFGPDTRRNAGETGSQMVRRLFPTEVTRRAAAAVANDAANRVQGGQDLVVLAGLGPTFFRDFPQFRNLRVIDSNDYSTYHALQVTMNRKFASGVTFQGAYTWSKSLDTRSYDPAFTTVASGNAQSASSTPFFNENRRLNYARSDFDRRHQFVGYAVWDMPWGKGSGTNAFVKGVIGGWTLSGDVRMTTGRPFTVFSGANQLSSIVNSTADCGSCDGGTGDLHFVNGVPFFFTPAEVAMFSQPAGGTVGTTGRNKFTHPGVFVMDMAVLKRTKITESQNIEVRFEFFNFTNHPSFLVPAGNAVITSGTFGRVADSLSSESRKVRVGLKYNF